MIAAIIMIDDRGGSDNHDDERKPPKKRLPPEAGEEEDAGQDIGLQMKHSVTNCWTYRDQRGRRPSIPRMIVLLKPREPRVLNDHQIRCLTLMTWGRPEDWRG